MKTEWKPGDIAVDKYNINSYTVKKVDDKNVWIYMTNPDRAMPIPKEKMDCYKKR